MTEDERGAILWRLKNDPDLPEDAEFEVLAYTAMLWSGWECDDAAVLYRILPDGAPQLHVLAGIGVTQDRLLETLEERLAVYEKVAADTRAFITRAKGLPPPREWRWICTACKTEGKGDEPKVCPTCGADDAWYSYNTIADDRMSARERMRNLGRKLRGEPHA